MIYGEKIVDAINLSWLFERTCETDKPRMTN